MVTSLPCAIGSSMMHAFTARDAPVASRTATVQLPQSPSAHPSLVPVSPLARRYSRRVRVGGRSETQWAAPFTVKAMAVDAASGAAEALTAQDPR